MTNSYPSGSGLPNSNMPTGPLGSSGRRSSYASVLSGTTPAQHPTRSGAFSHLMNQHSTDYTYDPSYQPMSTYPRYDSRGYDIDMNLNIAGNGGGLGRRGSWGRGGQLPSFSSAFGSLANGHGWTGGSHDQFLTPSYLKNSSYVQRLEEAHRAKVAMSKEGPSATSSQPGSLSTSASSVNLQGKLAPSHRGMTYDLIEKAPPVEEDELAPLPLKWNTHDKSGGLEVMGDGYEVKFTGPKSTSDRDHEACAIRADHPMPPQCGIYYFEVTIVSRKREESSIGIGFSGKNVPLSRLPGWEPDSWAYHGDDGCSFCCQSSGKSYGPPFTAGDIIGCGVNFRTGSAFFTKNGDHLGTAFRDIKGKLFPSVGMKKSGEHIRVNFGQSPFVFDIDGMMSVFFSMADNQDPGRTSFENTPRLVTWAIPDLAGFGNSVNGGLNSNQRSRVGANNSPTDQSANSTYRDDNLINITEQLMGFYVTQSQSRPIRTMRRRRRGAIDAGRLLRDHNNPTTNGNANLDGPADSTAVPKPSLVVKLTVQFTDLDQIKEEKKAIRESIQKTSTSKLAPPLNETDLIQQLVLQFLTHDGYIDTAKAFAKEVHAEKKALNLDPNAQIDGFDIKEDEDAAHRQRIRTAILEGDVDKALKYTNLYYPDVLNDNPQVFFRLRCRKFVELIQRGTELQKTNSTNGSKKSNGHSDNWIDDNIDQQMELDDQNNTDWNKMDTSEVSDEYDKIMQKAIQYGQSLQADYKDDTSPSVSKALQDCFALIAYADPAAEAKGVSYLLHPSERIAVAEELSSAILLSLGKSSTAALERLCQQTSVLLETLSENGGSGAMVNLKEYTQPSFLSQRQ
ncbi:SPRY domain-containing protein [Phlyctema vagabunda]|uniref:SPRY domain-containing protein n=1 Tax=Phlyctema vagabunda TaxID=108571 RepID=A0ABR4PGL5_9HELO